MRSGGQSTSLTQQMVEQFHWDHVAEAPGAFQGTQFELLASSERTPVEALSLHYPTEAPPLPSIAGTSAYAVSYTHLTLPTICSG